MTDLYIDFKFYLEGSKLNLNGIYGKYENFLFKIAIVLCGRKRYSGGASATHIRVLWFESYDEQVLPWGFYHTKGKSTG